MYYHILIETNEKVGKTKTDNRQYYETDKQDIEQIIQDIFVPYQKNIRFQFNGYFLEHKNITRMLIRKSDKAIGDIINKLNQDFDAQSQNSGIFFIGLNATTAHAFNDLTYMTDITKDINLQTQNLLDKSSKSLSKIEVEKLVNNEIFIVHGHDEAVKLQVARFLEKIHLKAIILHEQPNSGKTIIEKIDSFSNVGFAVALYTPCDVGEAINKKDKLQLRARQNVVFEHGYLIAKLGRKNVCALVKGNIETPSDIGGVVYTVFDDHEAWQMKLVRELEAVGYKIDRSLI